METITNYLDQASGFIWGIPLIVMLGGTGIYLTIKLRGLQFTQLGYALKLAFIKRHEAGEGDISHFQALMTALSATVGVGNIAGVATAIALGGPGALFWMWVIGWIGMATKYGEAILAVKYREKDEKGMMCGGPMYYIAKGLKMPWLGFVFALFTAIAAFGIGNMVQANTVALAVQNSFGISTWITGIIIAAATALVIVGGIKAIGRITSLLVPFMVVIYVVGCLAVLIVNWSVLPATLALILKSAFAPHAATGGFAGATVMMALRFGFARGIFSNESGLGSAPIAAAAAKTPNPVNQALVSMTQTFIDTVVICALTGLAIVSTGLWKTLSLNGAALSTETFNAALPGGAGNFIVSVGLILFAYSTVLGWEYYGEKAIEYIFGAKAIFPYRLLWVVAVFMGATLKLNLVWSFADLANGLMAIPNLIALIGLSGVIARETNKYLTKLKTEPPLTHSNCACQSQERCRCNPS
ncbi:MAG: sodium:alanine symporter family protein [Pseudomonadota bacterium]